MKTYDQLTEQQQFTARVRCLADLLEAITQGGLRFVDAADDSDGLQTRIDAAGDKANEMHTPWFWSEFIMDTCRAGLENMALADAEASLYAEPGERVIHGIVV